MTKLNFVGAKHLLPIALALTMCACGGGGTKPASDKAKTTEAAPSEKGKKAKKAKEFTPAATSKMASLGKTEKDKRVVYRMSTADGWEYGVYEPVEGKWYYSNYTFYELADKDVFVRRYAGENPRRADEKDVDALWMKTIGESAFQTWQAAYDNVKSDKYKEIVE